MSGQFFFFEQLPPPLKSTLFPYTTLFRSSEILQQAYWLRRESVAAYLNGTLGLLFKGNLEPMAYNQYVREVLQERSEEHTSELQSPDHLVCRLLLEKKKEKLHRTCVTKSN